MPIQLDYPDRFGRDNPQAYMRITAGSWTIGSTGFQITCQVFANKAAADAGALPLYEFSQFVPYDSSGMTSVAV